MERIRAHYLVERELADRLRTGTRADRLLLYGQVYDELHRRVPDHPSHTRVRDERSNEVHLQRLQPFLAETVTFLEVGAGDCAIARLVACHVRHVYALEVSEETVPSQEGWPDNLDVIVSDGISIPIAAGSIDLALSNQVLEHIHPEDAEEQTRNVCRALRPGGHYVVATPNGTTGPHDVSKYFGEVATGFHLKEWTTRELAAMLHRAGFSKVRFAALIRGHVLQFTAPLGIGAECASRMVPAARRRTLAGGRLGEIFGLVNLLAIAKR